MDISAFIPIPKAFTEQIGPYITSQDAEMCMWESVGLPGASWNLRMVLITSWASFQRFWLCSLTNSQIWLEVKLIVASFPLSTSQKDSVLRQRLLSPSVCSHFMFSLYYRNVRDSRLPPVNLEYISYIIFETRSLFKTVICTHW